MNNRSFYRILVREALIAIYNPAIVIFVEKKIIIQQFLMFEGS